MYHDRFNNLIVDVAFLFSLNCYSELLLIRPGETQSGLKSQSVFMVVSLKKWFLGGTVFLSSGLTSGTLLYT